MLFKLYRILLKDLFVKAFRESIPVCFGYLPLGAAFGILLSSIGLPWYFSTLSGLVVYAGAAQFLSVGLLSASAGLFEIFIAILILNIRHVFYGFSFLSRFRKAPLKPYLIFGLTDETYSVLSTKRESLAENDHRFCLMVTALNQSYWIIGCSIGGIFGSVISFNTRGFEFILTALFVVLTIEQWKSVKKWPPFLIGGFASFLALLFFHSHFLIAAMLMAVIFLIPLSRKNVEGTHG